jgi:hypothetical protein
MPPFVDLELKEAAPATIEWLMIVGKMISCRLIVPTQNVPPVIFQFHIEDH